jgi:hypothetical protein
MSHETDAICDRAEAAPLGSHTDLRSLQAADCHQRRRRNAARAAYYEAYRIIKGTSGGVKINPAEAGEAILKAAEGVYVSAEVAPPAVGVVHSVVATPGYFDHTEGT